ncbi:MAG TPA: ATP-binding protein [Candidatus Methanoperedens sp.]|nr:ATP-binding protein [Candidatus Methanoperedens sp.]
MNSSNVKRDIFGRIALVCSATTAVLGVLGMIGWLSGFRDVTGFGSYYSYRSPFMALEFVLLGCVWFFYVFNPSQRFRKVFALVLAFLILLIALFNLIQFFNSAQIGIENKLLVLEVDSATLMSPISDAFFLLDCSAMILLLLGHPRRVAGLSGGLSFIVISVNLVILLGYLYGAPLLYGGEIRPVELPVGVAFIVLSTGLIATSGEDYSLLKLILGPSVRALLLRYFLLVILIVALTDGVFYNILSQFKLKITISELQGLSALIYVIAVSAVVFQLSHIIGNALYRSETARKQAEDLNELLAREISNRERAEDELKQRAIELARSNAELEQYAYIASHDLQEPLRMITSFTQLLEKRYKGRLDNDADEFIGHIIDGATRMQMMINGILAYSRAGLSVKPFELTDCETVINQALDNLKIAIKESGAIVIHDRLPSVMADSSQMTTLIQNLLTNAIKFRKETPRIHVCAKQKRGEWIFSVQDNGIGISPEFIDRIFVLFYRLHSRDAYPGSGIGLATCKKIVERHGGRIWVESKLGKGSTFYFTIPTKRGE